jgi:hypothetical protein
LTEVWPIPLTKDDEPVLLHMNSRGDEFRIVLKQPVLVQGDLDILAQLKHLDRKLPFKEQRSE